MNNVRVTGSFITILLLAVPAVAGIGAARERADRDAARRLEKIGGDAMAAGQGAAARRILERALELSPENSLVRKALGFERKGREWLREPEEETRVRMLADSDAAAAAGFREAAREVEASRARTLARAAEKGGLDPDTRAVLLDCLDRVPREEAVHRALGHEEIDGRFVRPELVPLVRRRAETEARWAELRDAAEEPVEAAASPALPGVGPDLAAVRCGGRIVASVFGPKATELLARDTVAVHRLLRAFFPEGPVYAPSRVVVLDEEAWRNFVLAAVPDGEERRVRLARSDWHGDDLLVLRARTAKNARDVYAHVTGYFSAQFLAAPPDPAGGEGDVDVEAYAWLKEGFAYLLSLELFDTAETWFTSDQESTGKVRHVVPPPEVRTKATAQAWVAAHLLDGGAYPLPEVFGKTLNTLDLLASLEAWSFLRFLALHDPASLATLPESLRRRSPPPALEALWRAYVLEVV